MLPGAAVPAKKSSSEKGSRVYPIFTVTELAVFHCPNGSDKSLKIVNPHFLCNRQKNGHAGPSQIC